jgi:hypothetical protein
MSSTQELSYLGSGHLSPEAIMMYEQFGRIGNSTDGQAYLRITKADQLTFVDDTGTYVYIGNAVPGTGTSVASWKIRRVTTTNPVKVEYAAGSTLYNQVWDNRASLSYS